MDLKGSKTEKNLVTAFAGESQARNRYTYFASKAKKEGFRQIAEIFEETANQEKEHAKRLFKLMEGGEVEITDKFPCGVIGSTLENLKSSAGGEKHEWTEMYPSFAETAYKEGFDNIAIVFEAIAVAEKQHEKTFLALAMNIAEGKVFKKEKPAVWRCLNCGYIHENEEAPEKCPACAHARAHFEILKENYQEMFIMTKISEIYKCEICGNMVEIIHAGKGSLVCCGSPMSLLTENTVDASKEKHVPVVEKSDGKVKVSVGSAAHPMEEKHYIEWIEIISDGKVCKKFLKPGQSPEAFFDSDNRNIDVRAYCNLHGLWKAQIYSRPLHNPNSLLRKGLSS